MTFVRRCPRLTLAAMLLALLACFPPSAHPAEPSAMLKKIVTIEGITEYRLSNGLRVLLFPDGSTSKVTVNATVFVGSRHEGYGETGMAHLLEHMVFKGTADHPQIPKALRDRGAVMNGTTWTDRTNYFETLNASDDNLEFAIRLEGDRMFNSLIRREDLASEMTVVRNEFEAGENNPSGILQQRMMAAAYEWHNYGKSTIGNRSDIERVPIENLQAFYKKHYRIDNMMLVVAGNFKEEKALAWIVKYFGSVKKPEQPLDETYTEEPAQDGERTVVLRRVGSVAVVGALYHIPAGAHEDFAAVEVLTSMLTMEPSGRLYDGLVNSKKASSVSSVAFGWHDPGVMGFDVEVDKDHPIEAVRDSLLEILARVQNDKITDEEVERAKLKFAKNRKLQITDSNRIGITLTDWGAKGDWRLFFLHRDRVAKVTPEDVSRVARKYLQQSNRTVGMFIPSEKSQRAPIPATPDVAALVKDYKGGATIAAGEAFDPTAANIEKHVKQSELASGVKAALLPKKSRGEAVVASLTLHYGNEDSLKGHTSATQFLAPLMFRGTSKHTRQQIEDQLDKLGARLLPGGSFGDVSFSLQTTRDKLPGVLTLLGEILRDPSFPAAEFEVYKRQLRDALEQQRTDPRALATRALQRKLNPFPADHIRYTPNVEESIARLSKVTLEEVKQIYTEQLGGQAGELVIVGDFNPDEAVKQMDGILRGWKAQTPYRRIERPAKEDVKGERVQIETPDKENAIYIAGLMLPINDVHPDTAALEVGNYLFGGGALSSRLGNRVRQKEGLSYGVGSQFSADAQDKSARFMMFAIYNPTNKDKVDAAIADEMDKMLRSGVEAKEMEESKKAYLAQMKQRRSSDGALLGLFQEGLQAGRTFAYYADLEKKVADLTPEEVASAFRRHIDPKKLVIIQAGDFKKAR
jgi:zinc protease